MSPACRNCFAISHVSFLVLLTLLNLGNANTFWLRYVVTNSLSANTSIMYGGSEAENNIRIYHMNNTAHVINTCNKTCNKFQEFCCVIKFLYLVKLLRRWSETLSFSIWLVQKLTVWLVTTAAEFDPQHRHKTACDLNVRKVSFLQKLQFPPTVRPQKSHILCQLCTFIHKLS